MLGMMSNQILIKIDWCVCVCVCVCVATVFFNHPCKHWRIGHTSASLLLLATGIPAAALLLLHKDRMVLSHYNFIR
jgi:hypothetical protein